MFLKVHQTVTLLLIQLIIAIKYINSNYFVQFILIIVFKPFVWFNFIAALFFILPSKAFCQHWNGEGL